MPAGGERARIGRLHYQRRGADRPDPWNLCQAPAIGIGAVPGPQLASIAFNSTCNCAHLAALDRKQLARQRRHALVLRDVGQ